MMKMNFVKKQEGLNKFDVEYWKGIFNKNLKIGVEIECDFDNDDIDSEELIDELEDILKPTNNISVFGEYGVYKVDEDGSLPCGVEICTVGRRINFQDMVAQYYNIIRELPEEGLLLSSRCGLHNHFLLSYNERTNELEKNIPGVILKNFFQLCRLYFPAMVYITSTVESDGVVTRNNYFCNQDTLYKTSMINNTASEISNKLYGDDRYKAFNTGSMQFSSENPDEITKFHMELRFPDGSIYPVQIASQNVLYVALMNKAIKMSRYGILSLDEAIENSKELSTSIRNYGEWRNNRRFSEAPNSDEIDRIKELGTDMLNTLKTEILEISKDAYDVLVSLNETPISKMRESLNDKEINQKLLEIVKKNYLEEEDEDILKCICCTEITGQANEREWIDTFAKMNNVSKTSVTAKLKVLKNNYGFEFDRVLGSLR